MKKLIKIENLSLKKAIHILVHIRTIYTVMEYLIIKAQVF